MVCVGGAAAEPGDVVQKTECPRWRISSVSCRFRAVWSCWWIVRYDPQVVELDFSDSGELCGQRQRTAAVNSADQLETLPFALFVQPQRGIGTKEIVVQHHAVEIASDRGDDSHPTADVKNLSATYRDRRCHNRDRRLVDVGRRIGPDIRNRDQSQ